MPTADTTARNWVQNGMIVFPLAIIHSIIYRTLTWHSVFEPTVLHPTWLDQAIPFVPGMVWPYAAMVLVTIVAPLLIRSPHAFGLTLRAYALAAGTLALIYVVFPSRIVRAHRPAEEGPTWMLYEGFVRTLGDEATIPSGHIVFPLVMCWGLWKDSNRHACWMTTATLLASPSILLIKEHVVWDYFAALAVVFVVTRIASK